MSNYAAKLANCNAQLEAAKHELGIAQKCLCIAEAPQTAAQVEGNEYQFDTVIHKNYAEELASNERIANLARKYAEDCEEKIQLIRLEIGLINLLISTFGNQ